MSEEIIEETPVEETPVEETPVEETPTEPATVTFGRVINVPKEMFDYLADAIYPTVVPKPAEEITPDMPLEARVMPNPQSKEAFMQDWFDNDMLERFMTRFTSEVNAMTNDAIAQFTAQKRAEADAMIDAKREQVRALIARV